MKHEVRILNDEEFDEYMRQQKRQSFLQELENMSSPGRSSSFSIKDIKPKERKNKENDTPSQKTTEESSIGNINASTDEWTEFMEDIAEVPGLTSPIESVTDHQIAGYQLDDSFDEDSDKFGKVFSKELAMLSEVLKDVKAHGVRVNKELQKMTPTGKGAGNRSAGVSKGYSDLVEAYNSINTSKVQIIGKMADLKKQQVDWRIKDKASNPDTSMNTETIADLYYQRIINGGTKNFIQNNAQRYTPAGFEYDSIDDEDDGTGSPINQEAMGDPSTLDSLAVGVGFNITQPFVGSHNQGDEYINGDEFGNIRNEKGGIDICVYEYGEGRYQFVALDQDGEVVEGIELPSDNDPSIVNKLTVRPGSEYVYDKYNRKYRVIQMDGVDISDIDDMEYPFDDD